VDKRAGTPPGLLRDAAMGEARYLEGDFFDEHIFPGRLK
jgi:hypothetical protein